MKLKKLLFGGLLFTAFSLTALQSNAQAGRFGINAGANFSNITGKDAPDAYKLKTGFQAGVTYDIGIADDFVIQPGLSYVQNGAKIDGFDAKVQLNYLQLPVTFQYQPELGSGHLLLGVGPYVGMGIGQVKGTGGDLTLKRDWDEAGLKKIDAGGKLLAGYQLSNGLSLNLNANLGLLKLYDVDNPPTVNNTSFGVTVGYKF
ncbi:outer membrane beta-barrel protein [Niabella hibiscisoli]|uniref:outer membrane beta-barrel protein n=1 Tax=Niabella hibiscisoli TaxID=1825928 RepID=UPI001F0E4A08|nr:outer membrane beta-barrel protein [Niabella hibiscisoli]MCH5720690.1 PorT family protein [Niabella hibiscisoli]